MQELRKDFEVNYKFFAPEEGGRKSGPPAQLYRSDWSYERDDIGQTGIYMIWPIFLDADGQICEPDAFVRAAGKAQMYIVNDGQRPVHAKRLKPGIRGYFMEGPHRVAEAIVTRLLAIAEPSRSEDL